MKQLRKYQVEANNAIIKSLDNGVNKVINVLATGCGKTLGAVHLCKILQKERGYNRILWITHTEELLQQSGSAFLQEYFPEIDIATMIDSYGSLQDYLKEVKKMGMFAGEYQEVANKIGIVKAENFDVDADIVMASAQTLHRRLDKIHPDTFDIVICDECHLFAAKSFVKSINHFSPKLLLGLTATPHRADGASLADIFDDIAYQYSMFDAIQEGYLCELDALQIQTKLSLDNVKTTAGEFNQKDLKETVDNPARNRLLLDKYRQYANGLQNIIFCVDVEHAKNIYELFTEEGESAEILVGDESVTEDRKGVINRFKSGETKHLISVNIATAGFDHPGIGVLTLARPTKSLTLFIQMIGRGTRTLPGTIDGIETIEERRRAIKASKKPKCIVLDIVDTSSRHKIVNTWTLEKSLPIEERVYVSEERRTVMLEAREKRKLEASKIKDKRIDLFKLPKVKLSTSLKMKDPATEKQLQLLDKLGYDTILNAYTKGDANELISNHSASQKQVNFLRWKGYDVSNGVTNAEAKAAFEEIKKREDKQSQLNSVNNKSPIQGLN